MKQFLLTILLLFTFFSFALPRANDKTQQAVNLFIEQMVTQHHFNQLTLIQLFSKAKFKQNIIDLMNKPYEAKPWYQYRKHFLNPKRIHLGSKFWHKYKNALSKVSKQTGVPISIIVAIIGMESYYGKLKGSFSAFNVLYTFSFYYPRRERFFRNELKQYLLLCREQGWDPLAIKGSYAAALGQPQFMPSSYRAYAKSFSGKKHVNLFDHEQDVISSIGYYFSVHGWQRHQPIAVKAKITGSKFKQLPVNDRSTKINKPKMTLQKFSTYNIKPEYPYPGHLKATLMQFDLQNSKTYWLGFHNFYVITRYNTSKLYALSVYQLAKAIQKQYRQQYGK